MEKNNRLTLISLVLSKKDKENGTNKLLKVSEYFKPYSCFANIVFKDNFSTLFGINIS